MKRVSIYIDGFNLYFGLKSMNWCKYYWLDIHKLSLQFLKPFQEISKIKYFTSRIIIPEDKAKRQQTYLEAIATLQDVELFFGKYQLNKKICRNCGFVEFIQNEKMTDVNIANEMLADGFQNAYDVAILISADSDLVPPIKNIRSLFPEKIVIVAFPPKRKSKELQAIANGFTYIGQDKLRHCLLPDTILNKDNYAIHRPSEWS